MRSPQDLWICGELRTRRLAPAVCSIGSTDPTGAAGIGLDLVVYARTGVRGVFAVAAVTAQNASAVTKVEAVSPATIRLQLEAIWAAGAPAAIRIGLLPSARGIAAVRRFLKRLAVVPPTVLDPVLASTSGKRFASAAEIAELKKCFPLATLITPNADEAATLTGLTVRSDEDAERAAIRLAQYGCAVLVKGGHLHGPRSVDVLAQGGKISRFASPRRFSRQRGKGCRLAAAIAAELARGAGLEQAVRKARSASQRWIEEARQARPKLEK